MCSLLNARQDDAVDVTSRSFPGPLDRLSKKETEEIIVAGQNVQENEENVSKRAVHESCYLLFHCATIKTRKKKETSVARMKHEQEIGFVNLKRAHIAAPLKESNK